MKVLAVDDALVWRMALQAMVTSLGHECLVAANGREAWQILRAGGIEVLISDRNMPDMDGAQLCSLVRAQASTYVYVILATGLDDPLQVQEGMLAGADDYLVKPVRLEDLRHRLIAAERVSTLHRRLEGLNMELRAVARKDPLTGLGNRRSLHEDLDTLSARVRGYGHRYALAMYDIDGFADFNDRYGRPAGDQALQRFAQILASACEPTGDNAYRYGGEEFLVVYTEQSTEGAVSAATRVRAALATRAIVHAGSAAGGLLTVSVGIAEMTTDQADPADAMRQVDAALYHAQSVGRNCIEVADAPVRLLHPVR